MLVYFPTSCLLLMVMSLLLSTISSIVLETSSGTMVSVLSILSWARTISVNCSRVRPPLLADPEELLVVPGECPGDFKLVVLPTINKLTQKIREEKLFRIKLVYCQTHLILNLSLLHLVVLHCCYIYQICV